MMNGAMKDALQKRRMGGFDLTITMAPAKQEAAEDEREKMGLAPETKKLGEMPTKDMAMDQESQDMELAKDMWGEDAGYEAEIAPEKMTLGQRAKMAMMKKMKG